MNTISVLSIIALSVVMVSCNKTATPAEGTEDETIETKASTEINFFVL